MKIAIAGAGIGGLTAAALLHDAGHSVAVFTLSETPTPNLGVIIPPVGQMVLHQIGVRKDAMMASTPIRHMRATNAQGRCVLDTGYEIKGDGVFGMAISQDALIHILHQAVQTRGIEITTGYHITSCDDGRLISQGDHISGPFDLIVDAMGTKSPISPLRARDLKYAMAYGMVDWPSSTPLAPDVFAQKYDGCSHMAGVLACGEGKAALYWSFPSKDINHFRDQDLHAWQSQAALFWPEFAPFTAQITDMSQLSVTTFQRGCLPTMWATGLVHIGDAGHRSGPHFGQGANMALLDAAALNWALSHKSGSDALKTYRRARKKHINLHNRADALLVPLYQSNNPIMRILRSGMLLPPLRQLRSRLLRGDLTLPIRGVRRR